MRIFVATEARFHIDPNGLIRSDAGGRDYGFWSRYLGPFDSVSVIARVSETATSNGSLVAGEGVEVLPLHDYSGVKGWLRQWRTNSSRVTQAFTAGDAAYLARTPGLVGSMLVSAANRRGRPFALEVVGDPEEVLGSGAMPSALGRLLKPSAGWHMRRQCRAAAAVAYVTREQLQRKYPAARAASTTNYSSVELPPDAFNWNRKPPNRSVPIVINVAGQAQRYKGQDILIRAVASLRNNGQLTQLRLVGDGRLSDELRRLAETLGVAEQVAFLGRLPSGDRIRQELDDADIFVLPSRTEGLPRALLEAMARGLPCLSASVGGIPELLPGEDMFQAGDSEALASSLAAVIGNDSRLASMSRRNRTVAAEYSTERLGKRRLDFYLVLRAISTSKSLI